MLRTTLVTLKSRSQAFRMAMGVMHEGKADEYLRRCSLCGQEFRGNEDYCAGCLARVGDSVTPLKTTACSVCGCECLAIHDDDRNMDLCASCWDRSLRKLERKSAEFDSKGFVLAMGLIGGIVFLVYLFVYLSNYTSQ
jgi:hypothetical protein